MHGVYRTIINAPTNAFYWMLDYLYVILWQIVGWIRPADPGEYRMMQARHSTPIILLPGIYETWQFLVPIADMLQKEGYDVHVLPELGRSNATIEAMSVAVEEYVNKHGLQQCVIVAHSKGGLVGKYLLLQEKENRFKGLIALNTPFSGSRYAYLSPFRSLRIFLPTSPILKLLSEDLGVNKRILSIYGLFDPHIPGGSYLEGARNIRLETRGHFRTVKDARVHKAIIDGIHKF